MPVRSIGFAVSANLARPVVAQLKGRGKLERGWLGVRVQDLTLELAQSFGLSTPEGASLPTLPQTVPPHGPDSRQAT